MVHGILNLEYGGAKREPRYHGIFKNIRGAARLMHRSKFRWSLASSGTGIILDYPPVWMANTWATAGDNVDVIITCVGHSVCLKRLLYSRGTNHSFFYLRCETSVCLIPFAARTPIVSLSLLSDSNLHVRETCEQRSHPWSVLLVFGLSFLLWKLSFY